MRDEIAQKEDFESIQTIRGLESKKLLRQMADWNKHDPNLQECVEKNENRFEILKDDDEVID